jgi:acetyltransferase-like isoleucine patch superfamily enzyme
MRKITPPQILVFVALCAFAAGLGVLAGIATYRLMAPGDFRGIVVVAITAVAVFVFAIAAYRLLLWVAPLREGYVHEGSREEFVYHVYELFQLVLFQPLTRSHVVPVPLMRLIYRGLGARFGDNSYSGGTLLDPPLTSMGDNCIVGHDAVLFCHAVEGRSLALAPIVLGNNVTIGAKAVVMPGVTIGDDAVVAVGSVVAKGTRIGDGELWGGTPARKLRDIPAPTPTPSLA